MYCLRFIGGCIIKVLILAACRPSCCGMEYAQQRNVSGYLSLLSSSLYKASNNKSMQVFLAAAILMIFAPVYANHGHKNSRSDSQTNSSKKKRSYKKRKGNENFGSSNPRKRTRKLKRAPVETAATKDYPPKALRAGMKKLVSRSTRRIENRERARTIVSRLDKTKGKNGLLEEGILRLKDSNEILFFFKYMVEQNGAKTIARFEIALGLSPLSEDQKKTWRDAINREKTRRKIAESLRRKRKKS